jgi:glycosyltransferase involved in cell wall biosynthesis
MDSSILKTRKTPQGDGAKQHVCIVNVGLYRSGTTTLAQAAKNLGLKAYRKFPELPPETMKALLLQPEAAIFNWFENNDGLHEIIRLAGENDLICDGWISLLPFLKPSVFEHLKDMAIQEGVHLQFVATERNIQETVQSELQHWTVHDLERKAEFDAFDRSGLEEKLRMRAEEHQRKVDELQSLSQIHLLPLEKIGNGDWSKTLSSINDFSELDWSKAIDQAGKCNVNPSRPVEGILLTMRIGEERKAEQTAASVERLFNQIEEDRLCRYVVVLGIDEDEAGSRGAEQLVARIQSRNGSQMLSFHSIINPSTDSDKPFPICSVWDEMAKAAWKNGADWVVLLGDDVELQCSHHYRAIYRAFLDIQERFNVPFGFGCPWWNDTSFPRFPSFPCVGKVHFEIFDGLIPKNRKGIFINQDLDPYLHRLYRKFGAAPCVVEAKLVNTAGGPIGANQGPRYRRIAAKDWKDHVSDDTKPIREYLGSRAKEMILLDVVVPSYRIRLDYLKEICSLKVPKDIQTLFIIIIDNPDALRRQTAAMSNQNAETMTLAQGERILEDHLSQFGNHIRVRCNETNVGASASRNRGLDESDAEFILNLDDDLIPNPNLLEQYGHKLSTPEQEDIVGLIGLVRFPRSPALPLSQAAVLMSYLTFMFEIAERNQGMYKENPAWGVTANILFRRTKVRFDLAYAKTGGGEDVDFSLRVAAEASRQGGSAKLVAVPEACVVHPFWSESVMELAGHFFNWAIGDGTLLRRFPEFRYWSFPNFPETLLFMSPLVFWLGPFKLIQLIPRFLIADILVDMSNRDEYRHRCGLLQPLGNKDTKKWERSRWFYFAAHVLANGYVVVLECGRLWGHLQRPKPWRYICRRFDWHCGRLERAPGNFRRREACKFVLFCSMAIVEFCPSVGSVTTGLCSLFGNLIPSGMTC